MRARAYSVLERQHAALRDAAAGPASCARHDGRMLHRMILRGWIVKTGSFGERYELTDEGRTVLTAEKPELSTLRPYAPTYAPVAQPQIVIAPSAAELPPAEDDLVEVCCAALERQLETGAVRRAATSGVLYSVSPGGHHWPVVFCQSCGRRRPALSHALDEDA